MSPSADSVVLNRDVYEQAVSFLTLIVAHLAIICVNDSGVGAFSTVSPESRKVLGSILSVWSLHALVQSPC